MKPIQKYFFRALLLLFSMFPFLSPAQDGTDIEMADTFRQEGKIYVVIAVIAVILLGLILYLILIDRKVSKLEKKLNNGNR